MSDDTGNAEDADDKDDKDDKQPSPERALGPEPGEADATGSESVDPAGDLPRGAMLRERLQRRRAALAAAVPPAADGCCAPLPTVPPLPQATARRSRLGRPGSIRRNGGAAGE
jgi:hypothetical protein